MTSWRAALVDVDDNQRLLSTWNGEYLPDGHHINQGFAGDYSEAFTIESGLEIPDRLVAEQQVVIAELGALLDGAESPLEQRAAGLSLGPDSLSRPLCPGLAQRCAAA